MPWYPLTYAATFRLMGKIIKGEHIPAAEDTVEDGRVSLLGLMCVVAAMRDALPDERHRLRLGQLWGLSVEAATLLVEESVELEDEEDSLYLEQNIDATPSDVLRRWVPWAARYVCEIGELPESVREVMVDLAWSRILITS